MKLITVFGEGKMVEKGFVRTVSVIKGVGECTNLSVPLSEKDPLLDHTARLLV